MTTTTRDQLRALIAATCLVLVGCDVTNVGSADEAISRVERRSELTVLLDAGYAGAWPAGLDPATNTTARANLSLMNAIFGGLFQLSTDEHETPRIVGVLAEGYEIVDGGRTFIIRLRDGVTFSDGTPFDAAAVRFNIERNLQSPCTCAPTTWPWAAEGAITTPDQRTVELHFTRPYPAVVNIFPIMNVNWIASPSALQEMGEDRFRIAPVGAGPFRVVSNQLSSRLELERNPKYWQEGRPYVDRLVFQASGSEQAAIQALQAGDAQVYEGLTSTPLIEQAMNTSQIVVTPQPPTSPYVIQLNTSRPPFDDKRAREAIYYATDVNAIRKGLFHDWYPVSQSFTAPGGLFYQPVVPGYRTYDLERARSLVTEIGGVKVTLRTLRSFVAEQVATALQSQWQAAGIEVTIEFAELAALIQQFQAKNWEAALQTAGSYDPEGSGGVTFRFRSDQPFTGVWDNELDTLLREAAGSLDSQQRRELYSAAARYISDNAYAPFLFAFAPAQLTTRGITGPGLTTRIPPLLVNTAVLWQDVRISFE